MSALISLFFSFLVSYHPTYLPSFLSSLHNSSFPTTLSILDLMQISPLLFLTTSLLLCHYIFLCLMTLSSTPIIVTSNLSLHFPSHLYYPPPRITHCTTLHCHRYKTYEVLKEQTNNPRINWAYLPYSMHMAGPRGTYGC
jgi:hypothetical protein